MNSRSDANQTHRPLGVHTASLPESRLSCSVDSPNPTWLDRLSRRKGVPTLVCLSVCVAKESQESRKRVPV